MEENYLVINGGVTRCKKRMKNGLTEVYKETETGEKIVMYKQNVHSPYIDQFVFKTKEAAQKAIITGKVSATELQWRIEEMEEESKIYLAGFHVFHPDSIEIGKKMRSLCGDFGFKGLYPADNEPINNLKDQELATMIFYSNEGLIRESDIIIANLNSFRGEEPDSGTVFECGYGYALGKKLYGYIDNGSTMKEKLNYAIDPETGLFKDGMYVEDFNLPINLMLSIPMTLVVGTFADCIKKVWEDQTKFVS
ncbi:MAG: nucleoside 2-deoxyribosyltransferase [Bacillus sp. (in: firmicutes)]